MLIQWIHCLILLSKECMWHSKKYEKIVPFLFSVLNALNGADLGMHMWSRKMRVQFQCQGDIILTLKTCYLRKETLKVSYNKHDWIK